MQLNFGPNTAIYTQYLLFSITTVIIVMAKNTPGHWEESLIANITVTMNTTTSTNMLHTIRVVKLPLKQNKEQNFSSQYIEINMDIFSSFPFTYPNHLMLHNQSSYKRTVK